MTTETYKTRSKKTTLSVTNNTISAIKKSDTVKTGVRIYENGCIGVAGAIGAYDEKQLSGRAKHMLSFKIPYDCESAGEISRTMDLTDSFSLSDEEFVRSSEEVLSMLTRNHPQFSFSHKIFYEETETQLHNSNGADLAYRDKIVQFELVIKHKGSKNLMDGIGATYMRGIDVQAVYNAISETCGSFEEKVTLPEEKMPVVQLINKEFILQKFLTDLHGRAMGANASLFSGKIGEKLFADHFSLCVQRDPLKSEGSPSFFDAEGTVLPDNRFMLIENGVIKAPYSSKKIAKQYGYPVTGSAGGEYDSVPVTAYETISVQPGEKTIKELLGGRKAVYIVIASGGDFTSQGEYASPVQAAYLFDGENLLGRLPQLSIRSNVYDMFGKDFIGMSTDGNNPHCPFKFLATDMYVEQIGDWL